MANKLREIATLKLSKEAIGQAVDEFKTTARDNRRSFERRWYDNNFFDDGFHFRYLSRQQNKIVDMSEKGNLYTPFRAIPKTSRQIRGIANLLTSPRYVPVAYPQKLVKENFEDPKEYLMAKEGAGIAAKRQGNWLEHEFKLQNITEKMAFMIILAAKHGVSFMQVWPDSVKEAIRTQVYDAFDIYLMGNYTEIEDSPFIIKAVPRLVSEIKADERFDPEQTAKISPDNRLASSEIKEAYARARFGGSRRNDNSVTVIQNEAFIKEFLNKDVRFRIEQQEDAQEILMGKKDGDCVMRQVFTVGNIALKDNYIKLYRYPFVDFRMEPGPIYQVPLIERFIPSNKSLDMAVSRLERFFHTMNTGIWLKRQGEQMEFSNQAGGQVVEYSQTKPEQATIVSPSAMSFPFLGFLSSLIEEQGVSTSTLGKIPTGVKANAAIESLKESEYASLQIAQERLRGSVKRIAERFLDIADDYFVQPQTVYLMKKGEPDYFDVIGATALKKRRELGVADDVPQYTVPINGNALVEIQVEEGLAFTSEGKKKRAKEIMDSIYPYVRDGLVSPEAFKIFLQSWLETWKYGPISEIMAEMENVSTTAKLTEQQLTEMKIAVLEALKEAGEIGPQASDKRVMENKVGVLEALKESGLAKALSEPKDKEQEKEPSKSISFKDLPPSGKAQLAAQAGINLDEGEILTQEFRQAAMKAKPKEGGSKNAAA